MDAGGVGGVQSMDCSSVCHGVCNCTTSLGVKSGSYAWPHGRVLETERQLPRSRSRKTLHVLLDGQTSNGATIRAGRFPIWIGWAWISRRMPCGRHTLVGHLQVARPALDVNLTRRAVPPRRGGDPSKPPPPNLSATPPWHLSPALPHPVRQRRARTQGLRIRPMGTLPWVVQSCGMP